MQAVFTKIISFIFSLLMPITGFFSGGTPVSNSDIFVRDGGVSSGAQIISTYEDFLAYFGERTDEESKANEFLGSIDENYFETGNLAIIGITLANTAETVVVTSAAESEDTLKVSYIIELEASFGLSMLCSSSICVKTSKNITKIEAEEKGGFTSLYRSFMGHLIEIIR